MKEIAGKTKIVLVFVSGTFFIGKIEQVDTYKIVLNNPRIIMFIPQGPNAIAIAMPEITGSPQEISIRYDAWYECNNVDLINRYVQETTGLIMTGGTRIKS